MLKEATDRSSLIALRQGDELELGKAYVYQSDLYFQRGDINNYLLANQKALALLDNTDEYSLQEEALNNIATAYGEKDDIDSLMFFTKKAIGLNLQYRGLQGQLGNEYQNMSYAYSMKGVLDSSIHYTQKAIEALVNAKDTLRMLDAYNQLGVVYVKNKEYPLAIKYFEESLSIYEKVENKHNRLYIYTNLAATYQKMGDQYKAVEFSRKSVLDAEDSSEKITYGKLLCNLAGHLYRVKHFHASIDTLRLSLPYIKNSHYYLGAAYQLLASNYSAMSNIDSTSLYLSLVDSLASVRQFTRSELFYASKVNMLVQQSKYKEAVPYVYKFIEIDSQQELKNTNPLMYNLMSEVLEEGAGDYREALKYRKIASSLQDSLCQKESTAKLNEFYAQYKTAEKELEILHLNEERQRILYSRILIVVGFVSVIVLLILTLLYSSARGYKREKESLELEKKVERKEFEYKTLLNETESRLIKKHLEGRELERKSLAKELHNSVANEIVSAIMLYDSGDEKKQLQSILKNIYNHIRQVSHKLMPPEFRYMSLIGMLEDYVNILNNGSTTHFVIDITDVSIPDIIEGLVDSQKKAIYYIIQEALGNICKHAEAKNGKIAFSLSEDHKLILSIKDDGVGFCKQQKSDGIGLQSMKDRSMELNAELKIESVIGIGTTIMITPFCSLNPTPNLQS